MADIRLIVELVEPYVDDPTPAGACEPPTPMVAEHRLVESFDDATAAATEMLGRARRPELAQVHIRPAVAEYDEHAATPLLRWVAARTTSGIGGTIDGAGFRHLRAV